MLMALHQDSSLDAHILKQEQKICFGLYLVSCDLIMSQVHMSSTDLLNHSSHTSEVNSKCERKVLAAGNCY